MTRFVQRLRSLRLEPGNRLWAAYFVFASFLILDGFFYLLSPYSGRISTLVCRPSRAENARCTVTIYGLRETYRRSFTAEQFIEALVIHNYTGDSLKTTYGITLLTATEKINFVHPYQAMSVAERKAQQINDAFVDAPPASPAFIIFLGFNRSLYVRGLLLILGLVYVLSRIKTGRSWLLFAPKSTAPRKSFWRLVIYWAGNNFLLRAGFYFSILLTFNIFSTQYTQRQFDLVTGCLNIPFIRQSYFDWNWGYLLCFYPLAAILVLKGLAQQQMLSSVELPTSHWWLIAPLAAAPVLIALAPQLYCEDCITLKYLPAGIIDRQSTCMIALAAYFVCLGVIQWLAVRKKLALSVGWVLMPLLNTMLVVPMMAFYWSYYAVHWRDFYNTGRLDELRFYLPAGIILLTTIISELIPALYLAWLVKRRSAASLGD